MDKLPVYPDQHGSKYGLMHASDDGVLLWEFENAKTLIEFLGEHQHILSYSDIDLKNFTKKYV